MEFLDKIARRFRESFIVLVDLISTTRSSGDDGEMAAAALTYDVELASMKNKIRSRVIIAKPIVDGVVVGGRWWLDDVTCE